MRLDDLLISCYTYPKAIWTRFWDYRHQRLRPSDVTTKRAVHPASRTGLHVCICLIALVFCCNLAAAIWARTTQHVDNAWTVTLHRGDCGMASRTNFWVHLLVNVFASSLFAASSYVMQRLAAPTREDIDRAHAKDRPLRIGTLAIMNFALMNKKRLAVFILLWTSSLPVHLMYNSLFQYTTTDAQALSYVEVVALKDLPDPSVNATFPSTSLRTHSGYQNESVIQNVTEWLVSQQPPLRRMEVDECLRAYAAGSSIEMGDLIIVGYSNQESYPPKQYLECTPNDHDPRFLPWTKICGYFNNNCDPGTALQDNPWTIFGMQVQYCLARKMPQQCELNMSLTILIVVMICNVCKLLAVVMSIFIDNEQPLLTIGDAISSFLQREDETTKGLSIAQRRAYSGFWDTPQVEGSKTQIRIRTSRQGTVWAEMAGAFFWSSVFGGIFLVFSFGFFGAMWKQAQRAYSSMDSHFSFSTMWNIGLGKLPPTITDNQESIINYAGSTSSASYIDGACVANLPQLALSFLYLFYNNFYTRLCLAFEFRSFAIQRRGLRVSNPIKGSEQRPTYFLQFPLKWSLLMLGFFVILHTIMSESMFLRRSYFIWPQSFTDEYDIGRQLSSQLGFSLLGFFFLSLWLSILVIGSFGIGFMTRDWVLPCLNGDSRSISAACHPPEDSKDTHLGPVRWGVVSMELDDVGLCSFSALPVRPPENGEKFH